MIAINQNKYNPEKFHNVEEITTFVCSLNSISMKGIAFNDYYKDILLSIPLFRDLNLPIKRRLVQELDFRLYHIQSHEIVLRQGEACSKLYILLQGELEVTIIDASGNEVLIENIVAPRAFATPHLFNEDNRFPATFKAIEESILLTATKDSTFRLISECPDILKSFLCVSGRCNMCTTVRLDVLSRKTIRERILVYLFKKLNKDGTNTVRMRHTLTQLAEYLNVTRPALSTEFNKMEREGMLKRMPDGNIELNLAQIKKLI